MIDQEFDRYQLYIWDWNGTLLDDAQLCHELTNQQLEELDLPAQSDEVHQHLFQHPITAYYEAMGVDLSRVSFETLANQFHDRYAARRGEVKLRRGIVQILEALQRKGKRQAILSAHPQQELERLVEEHGLSHFFEAILGLPDRYAHSKIKRGVEWLNGHSLERRHVLLIGDTDHDYQSAQAMGVSCLLCPSGWQSTDRLRACRVGYIPDLAELLSADRQKST